MFSTRVFFTTHLSRDDERTSVILTFDQERKKQNLLTIVEIKRIETKKTKIVFEERTKKNSRKRKCNNTHVSSWLFIKFSNEVIYA